ncbi:hypothetical protein PTKIN_Ptkin16aG0104100 [Pterospermum kingtungense]
MLTSLEKVIKICTRWQIQALTLVSLLLQVILIVFGSKRKATASKWISILVWSAYLSADWVATVALGILARSFREECGNDAPIPNSNYSLRAFWAPFILLHLGGPDTITAYSIEDNELWLRHLLGLVFEVGVAIYVYWRSWGDTDSHSTLSFIAILVYIAGIIKYGERTWVLRSSSTKQYFKNFILSRQEEVPQTFLQKASFLFERLKALFSGFILHREEGHNCKEIICSLEPTEAFKLVEFELGLLFDVLYTKATVVYSCVGIILRCITFLASISALITFSIISHERSYLRVDISVTYLLLVGAVVLEVYALVIVTSSDWTRVYLVRQKTKSFSPKKVTNDHKRWSRAIAQYNLIDFCLPKERTAWMEVQALLGIRDILKKHRNVSQEQGVLVELQGFIFNHLKKRIQMSGDYLENSESCRKLLNHRGDGALIEKNCLDVLKWSTIDVEFNQSLFIWHIATELCYYDDIKEFASTSIVKEYSKISRCLSSYMIYLLFLCPHMLPKGSGLIGFNEACAEATRFLLRWRGDLDVEKACQKLLSMSNDNDRDPNTLLFKGCRLANQLQTDLMKNQKNGNWGCKEKWEMMNQVWMELLTYAASHCGWKEHAHQLTKGGELLTHVCLLMAHFGLSEQYQDSPSTKIFGTSISVRRIGYRKR